MDIETLKREAENKPSRVAFRKIKLGLYVSVKCTSNADMCMEDQYDWSLGDQRITESKAADLLKDFV